MLFLFLFLFLSITFLCITLELLLNSVVFIAGLIFLSSVNFNNLSVFLSEILLNLEFLFSKFQQNLGFLFYQEFPLVFNFSFFIGLCLFLGFFLNFLNSNVTGFGLAKVLLLFLTFYSIRLIFVFWRDIDVAYLLVVSFCIFILGFCYKVFLEVYPEFQNMDGKTNQLAFFFCFIIGLFTPFFLWIFLWFLIYSLFFILEKLFFGLKNEMFWLNFMSIKKLEFFYIFFLVNIMIVEITGESVLVWLSLVIESLWIKIDTLCISKTYAMDKTSALQIVKKMETFTTDNFTSTRVLEVKFPTRTTNLENAVRDYQRFQKVLRFMNSSSYMSFWFYKTEFVKNFYVKSLLVHPDIIDWSKKSENKHIFFNSFMERLDSIEITTLRDPVFSEMVKVELLDKFKLKEQKDEKFRFLRSTALNIFYNIVEMNKISALNLENNPKVFSVIKNSLNYPCIEAFGIMDESNQGKFPLKSQENCDFPKVVDSKRASDALVILEHYENVFALKPMEPNVGIDYFLYIKNEKLSEEYFIAVESVSPNKSLVEHLEKDLNGENFSKKIDFLKKYQIKKYHYFIQEDKLKQDQNIKSKEELLQTDLEKIPENIEKLKTKFERIYNIEFDVIKKNDKI